MGFLSGLSSLSGALGGSSSSKSSGSGQSGFALLPPELQQAFKQYGTQVNNLYKDPNKAAAAYTPIGQTADETAAFDKIRQGFAPTADSLKADLAMLQNPWEDAVLDPIQRSAQSDYSILKQNSSANGQFGSNRQQLGANDIENTREANIGQMRSNQYNQAINQIFNNLMPQRAADAQNQLGIGTFDRNLAASTAQAPYTALAGYGGMLNAIPQTGGSTQQQSSSSQGESGGIGGLAKTAGTIASIAGFFSDRRLKQDIEFVGLENGHKVYEFAYKGAPARRFQGVMADEVQEIAPHAVIGDPSSYMKVDYDLIGVRMREV